MSLQAIVGQTLSAKSLDLANDSGAREGVRDIISRLNPADANSGPALGALLTEAGIPTDGNNFTQVKANYASYKAAHPECQDDQQVAMSLLGVPKDQWGHGLDVAQNASGADFTAANLQQLGSSYSLFSGGGTPPPVSINPPAPPITTPVKTTPAEPPEATLLFDPTPATALPSGTAVPGAPATAGQLSIDIAKNFRTLGLVITGNDDYTPHGSLIPGMPADGQFMETYANQSTLPSDWTVYADVGYGKWYSLGTWNEVQATLSQPNGQQNLINEVAAQLSKNSQSVWNFSG